MFAVVLVLQRRFLPLLLAGSVLVGGLILAWSLIIFRSGHPVQGDLPPAGENRPSLVIGVPPGYRQVTSQLLEVFAREFPGLPYTMVTAPISELRSRLKDGALTCLIGPHPGEIPGLASHFIGCQVTVLATSMFRSPPTISWGELPALLREEITDWRQLGQTPGRLQLMVSPVALEHARRAHSLPDREEHPVLVNARVTTIDRDSLLLLPAREIEPPLRALPLAGVHPLEAQEDYPLAEELYLTTRRLSSAGRFAQLLKRLVGSPPALTMLLASLQSPDNPYWPTIPPTATMVAVGDIMLNRGVEKVGRKEGWVSLVPESTAAVLRAADLTFANLESPIGDRGRFLNMFQADPQAVSTLETAGIDVVSVANNHILDYDTEGFWQTLEILDAHGIKQTGAGRNLAEARSPLICRVGQLTVAFLAYTEMWFVYTRHPHHWAATPALPGVAPARVDYVAEDVARASQLADLAVVSLHWGKEYSTQPTPSQRELAHTAVDHGAALVIGHHPHVLQGIELYKEGIILYSLGNFIFDLGKPETWETLICRLLITPGRIRQLELIPARIDVVRPRLLQGEQAERVLRSVEELSLDLNELSEGG